jgi:cobalamin synthase
MMKDDAPPSRKGAAAALAVIVALLIAGIALQRLLRESGKVEDCMMSGRTNCAPISNDSK